MIIRFISAMFCGALLVLVTTTGSFAQMGGGSHSLDPLRHISLLAVSVSTR